MALRSITDVDEVLKDHLLEQGWHKFPEDNGETGTTRMLLVNPKFRKTAKGWGLLGCETDPGSFLQPGELSHVWFFHDTGKVGYHINRSTAPISRPIGGEDNGDFDPTAYLQQSKGIKKALQKAETYIVRSGDPHGHHVLWDHLLEHGWHHRRYDNGEEELDNPDIWPSHEEQDVTRRAGRGVNYKQSARPDEVTHIWRVALPQHPQKLREDGYSVLHDAGTYGYQYHIGPQQKATEVDPMALLQKVAGIKKAEWQGKPIAGKHSDQLEVDSALNEFKDRMPRAEAEKKAYEEYKKGQHTDGAIHHLRAMRAAQAASDDEAAKKHSALFTLHMKELGHDPYGELPKEIQERLKDTRSLPPMRKFHAHRSDSLVAKDKEEVKKSLADFDYNRLQKALDKRWTLEGLRKAQEPHPTNMVLADQLQSEQGFKAGPGHLQAKGVKALDTGRGTLRGGKAVKGAYPTGTTDEIRDNMTANAPPPEVPVGPGECENPIHCPDAQHFHELGGGVTYVPQEAFLAGEMPGSHGEDWCDDVSCPAYLNHDHVGENEGVVAEQIEDANEAARRKYGLSGATAPYKEHETPEFASGATFDPKDVRAPGDPAVSFGLADQVKERGFWQSLNEAASQALQPQRPGETWTKEGAAQEAMKLPTFSQSQPFLLWMAQQVKKSALEKVSWLESDPWTPEEKEKAGEQRKNVERDLDRWQTKITPVVQEPGLSDPVLPYEERILKDPTFKTPLDWKQLTPPEKMITPTGAPSDPLQPKLSPADLADPHGPLHNPVEGKPKPPKPSFWEMVEGEVKKHSLLKAQEPHENIKVMDDVLQEHGFKPGPGYKQIPDLPALDTGPGTERGGEAPVKGAYDVAPSTEPHQRVFGRPVRRVTLPAHLASALINGDESGLEEGDRPLLDAAHGLAEGGHYVDVGEPYFGWHHDLSHVNHLGGDVAEYTILGGVPSQMSGQDRSALLAPANPAPFYHGDPRAVLTPGASGNEDEEIDPEHEAVEIDPDYEARRASQSFDPKDVPSEVAAGGLSPYSHSVWTPQDADRHKQYWEDVMQGDVAYGNPYVGLQPKNPAATWNEADARAAMQKKSEPQSSGVRMEKHEKLKLLHGLSNLGIQLLEARKLGKALTPEQEGHLRTILGLWDKKVAAHTAAGAVPHEMDPESQLPGDQVTRSTSRPYSDITNTRIPGINVPLPSEQRQQEAEAAKKQQEQQQAGRSGFMKDETSPSEAPTQPNTTEESPEEPTVKPDPRKTQKIEGVSSEVGMTGSAMGAPLSQSEKCPGSGQRVDTKAGLAVKCKHCDATFDLKPGQKIPSHKCKETLEEPTAHLVEKTEKTMDTNEDIKKAILEKKAPPGFSEDTIHKLKRKHGVKSAFKIAWAAHGRKGKKGETKKSEDAPFVEGLELTKAEEMAVKSLEVWDAYTNPAGFEYEK